MQTQGILLKRPTLWVGSFDMSSAQLALMFSFVFTLASFQEPVWEDDGLSGDLYSLALAKPWLATRKNADSVDSCISFKLPCHATSSCYVHIGTAAERITKELDERPVYQDQSLCPKQPCPRIAKQVGQGKASLRLATNLGAAYSSDLWRPSAPVSALNIVFPFLFCSRPAACTDAVAYKGLVKKNLAVKDVIQIVQLPMANSEGDTVLVDWPMMLPHILARS